MREHGPLDPARAIDIVIQILRAARFAHRRGVIHRDLKPHNVILDEEGRARVTDFGIARAGASDMTLTGSIMGTAQYLSPGAGPGLRRQRRLGPLLDRRDPLRAAHRRRAVRRRDRGGDRLQAGLRRAAAAERAQPGPAAGARRESCCARSPRTRLERYADADEFIAALERERAVLPAGGEPYDGHAVAAHPHDPPTGVMLAPPLLYEERPPDDRESPNRRWVWWVAGTLAA